MGCFPTLRNATFQKNCARLLLILETVITTGFFKLHAFLIFNLISLIYTLKSVTCLVF